MADENLVSITKAEHISPLETGDNIQAKRVASYGWDGTDWQRQGLTLVPLKDFDYLSITATGANQDTLVFKLGGSGGTTIQTLVIDYAPGAAKASDDLSALTWS